MRLRRWVTRASLAAGAMLGTGFDCSGSDGGPGGPEGDTTWAHPGGTITVVVSADPFALRVRDAQGDVLLESTFAHDAAADDPLRAYAPLAFTHDQDLSTDAIVKAWDYYRGQDDPWKRVTRAKDLAQSGDTLVVHLATDDGAHGQVTLTISPSGRGVRIAASVDDPGADPDSTINRVSLGFAMHDDDHFFGLGERFVRSDHRGQDLYAWVEGTPFAQGEDVPPGPTNPIPHGETMTGIPIPWFLSPRGFGMLGETTFRSVHHLGDQTGDAWRVEQWSARFEATVFADPDPMKLVEDLTAVTGRPPQVADWVLAPRRRGDVGGGEWDKLRAAHVPTSVIDTAVHYFPNGGIDHAQMKATTSELHKKGFKAVAYFCAYVADSWHPVFEDAGARGYFVRRPDGSPYTFLNPPYTEAMVDFTNPEAVAWYQSQLQSALDDGWDGWMYDFAEFVPQDAVFANGMRGMEAHNLYPVLYQKAAFDLLEKQRRGDYLVFVRSGYSGSGGLVPMVWAGDDSTDFDTARGLPAVLVAALNLGMSGLPLWGSDIGGYDFVYNPPPDKELYLRWTELGAFSADMHDENAGEGTGQRWQIWSDQQTVDVYRTYAGLKTRMLPYVKLAVAQARARGTPVMRHLYLLYPRDPNVYGIGDEYMYGDSLLVAPVVARGQTQRSVYLPEAQYFDFFSGARVAGRKTTLAPAPPDAVPVYAKVGAIVPMLAPDVETVVPSTDGSVVSAADRADFLEVAVFAGGQSSVTLDDGTTLSQSAPSDAFTPTSPAHAGGAIAAVASEAELMTCDACAWDDPPGHVWKVAVKTQADTITAGPLTLDVKGSPTVKRFLFSVRH